MLDRFQPAILAGDDNAAIRGGSVQNGLRDDTNFPTPGRIDVGERRKTSDVHPAGFYLGAQVSVVPGDV